MRLISMPRTDAAESDQGKNPNPTVDGALVVTKDDGDALQFTLLADFA